MVNIVTTPEWKSVRILEQEELALGGENGNMNEQAVALVARSEFLKQRVAYQYNTLAEANADIANIAGNQNVNVVDSGLYKKATVGATTLTKSPFDPLAQSKSYTDTTVKQSTNTTLKTVAITGDATVSELDASNKILVFTGTLTADAVVTLPAITAEITLQNGTTGGFSVLLKVASSSTTELKNGEIFEIVLTATNIRKKNNLVARLNSPALTGTPIAPTFPRGSNSTQIATTAYTDGAISHARTSLKTFTLTGDVSATKTLTDDDLSYAAFDFGGVLTQDITFIIPKTKRGRWVLRNYTSGSFNIYVKVLDQASPFLVKKSGVPVDLFSDGGVAYDFQANLESKLIDSSNATIKALAITGNYTVSSPDARNKIFVFTGALTADAIISFPAVVSEYTIQNATTGGFKLLISTNSQAVPVPVRNGDIVEVFNAVSSIRPKNALTPTLIDATYGSLSAIDLSSAPTEKVLTVAQVDAAYLNIVGALTNNVTLVFPDGYRRNWTVRNNTTGGFDVFVKGASQVVAANKLIKNSAITMQQIYSNGFVVMTSESTGGGVTPSPTDTAYKGLFKFGSNYEVGDIVEHGSGNYVVVSEVASADTTPNLSVNYVKQSHNLYAGANRTIEAKNVNFIIDQTYSSIPASMSNNGMIMYNMSVQNLQHSKDFGKTWQTIYTKPTGTAVIWVKPLNNGELLFMDRDTTTQQHSLYRTVGYDSGRGTISSVVFINQVDLTKPKMTISPSWSVDVYDNIVLVAQYGPKTGLDWNGVSALPGENARYVYMSLDHGLTWTVALDLNAQVGTDAVHLHGVCYDPYWQRIWVTSGDGAWTQTTTMYSDDLGATWKFAHRFIKGEGGNPDSNTATDGFRHQNVNIMALPTCILFATDGFPDGIQRIDRAQGKHTSDGLYDIELAHYIDNGQTTGSYLCQATCKSSLPDSPYLFGFSAEFQNAPTVVIATYDGWKFFEVWRDSLSLPPANGILAMVGITPKNQIVLYHRDTRSVSNLRTKVEITV